MKFAVNMYRLNIKTSFCTYTKKIKILALLFVLLLVSVNWGPTLWGMYLISKSVESLGGEKAFNKLVTREFEKYSTLNQIDLDFITIGLPEGFENDEIDEFKPSMYSLSNQSGSNLVISNRLLDDVNVSKLVSRLKRNDKFGIGFIESDFDLFSSLVNLTPKEISVFSSAAEVEKMLVLLNFRMIYVYKTEREFNYFKLDDRLEAIQLREHAFKGRVLLFDNKNWLAEINYDSLSQDDIDTFLANLTITQL